MEKIRTIVVYKHYFEEFLLKQIFEIIEFQQNIPKKFLSHIQGTDGLFETKFSLGTNIWRVFCFFDKGKLVILLNGFQKKSQKTPKSEISIALRLMNEYFEDKRKEKL